MRTKQQDSFTSVISINPYSDEYFSNASDLLLDIKSASFSKKQFAVSFINTRDYIDNQIEISKNIPEEDILDAINIKVYDELGLDQAVEYKIQYIETFHNLDGDNRHFQVFIVNPIAITEIYEKVVNQVKYIDTITPAPLLIKSLYSKEIIQDNGIHCFIYFEENDAFLTIYNEKDFIYTKSLKYSLAQMHERFCELYGERIEYSAFTEFLSTQNLKTTTSDYKDFIFKLYKEIFASINDILAYTKKAFNIEKVERIYIGSQINIISKLYELAEFELSIKSSDFSFDYDFHTKDEHIDQIHALMLITAELEDEEKYLCNFSIFNRPPKFTKRESGKFLIFFATSFLIAFIYPITYWILLYSQEIQYKLEQKTYTKVHNERVTREAIIKSREADKVKVLELLKVEEKSYNDKKNTLIKIHDVKVNYPMKAKLITLLTNDLNKYEVRVVAIKYDQANEKKKFTFDLVSPKDKKITQLIKHLTKKHERKFKFSLENILYDEEQKLYFSELKVYIL